jgi:hypothetical protein
MFARHHPDAQCRQWFLASLIVAVSAQLRQSGRTLRGLSHC